MRITNVNKGFLFEPMDEESSKFLLSMHEQTLINTDNVLVIAQNPEDLDLDDRIIVFLNFIENTLSR